MDVTKAQEGYGKFEETVHELEQAAAEKVQNAGRRARQAELGGLAVLADAVRDRPVFALLIAGAAGYALSWLSDRR